MQSRSPTNRQPISALRNILLPGLIFVILVGGIALGFYVIRRNNQKAVTTITAHTQSTASAAYSTVTAITRSQPIFTDSLSHNTVGRWQEDKHCVFQGGSYHVHVSDSGFCSMNIGAYSNIAIQVDVSLLSGDAAGLLFRGSGESTPYTFYYFFFDRLGSVGFCIDGSAGQTCPLQDYIPNPPIQKKNVLLVIAQRSSITLYMNGIFIHHLQDSTSASGWIAFGVEVTSTSQSGDASFSDLKVYRA